LIPVVQELDARGWRNKEWRTQKGMERGGRPFDKCSVYALLTNPLYAGMIKHKNDIFLGEHEPIIESGIFEDVQRQLNKNGRGKGNHLVNKYGAILKGLLYCRSCGRAMVHTFTGKGTKRYRYYTCCTAIKKGWNNCPTKSVPAGEIEAVVVEQIRAIADDQDLLNEVYVQACSETNSELDELSTQRQQHERQLARDHAEIRRLAIGPDPNSVTTCRIADLHERVSRNEQQLAQILARVKNLESQQITHQEVMDAFKDFDNIWSVLNTREQTKVISLLVARIEFDVIDCTIAISFHPSAIKSMATKTSEDAA
jgi:site-specific DNA recombinase